MYLFSTTKLNYVLLCVYLVQLNQTKTMSYYLFSTVSKEEFDVALCSFDMFIP